MIRYSPRKNDDVAKAEIVVYARTNKSSNEVKELGDVCILKMHIRGDKPNDQPDSAVGFFISDQGSVHV